MASSGGSSAADGNSRDSSRRQIDTGVGKYSGIDLESLPTGYAVDGEKIKSHGNVYHLKTVLWHACKGLGTNQFRISCEMRAAGKFNDIIFQYDTGREIAIKLFQLKHFSNRESNKLTNRDFFQQTKGPFSLDRYFSTFVYHLDGSFEETYRGRIEEIAFFTNVDMKFTASMNKRMFDVSEEDGHEVYRFGSKSRSSNVRRMICTGSVDELKNDAFANRMKSLLATFFAGDTLKPEANGFFDILRIHVGVAMEYVDRMVSECLESYLGAGVHTGTIRTRLSDRITDWVSRPTGEFLRKSDFVAWIEDIKNNIPNRLVAYHDLQVNRLRALDVEFVEDSAETFSVSLRTTGMFVNVVTRCDISITAVKLMQSLKNVRFSFITGLQFVLYSKDALLNDMRLCGSSYLVIVCDAEASLDDVYGALIDLHETNSERIENERFVAITRKALVDRTTRLRHAVLEDQVGLEDLSADTQRKILDKTVTFRERATKVSSIVLETMRQIIKNDILSDLVVSSDIKIGKLFVSENERKRTVEERKCYIERSLKLCNALRRDVFLEEFVDDLLVVSNITEREFEVLYLESLNSKSAISRTLSPESVQDVRIFDRIRQQCRSAFDEKQENRILGKRVFVSKSDDPEGEFREICSVNQTKNVSWIEYDGDGKFYWKKTYGSVRNLRSHVDRDSCSNASVDGLSCVDGNVVLIVGAPGTGKSVLLSHLLLRSSEHNPDAWVIKIDLAAYTKRYAEETFRAGSVLEFLTMTQRFDSELETILFREYFNTKRTTVLFDAFDEIAPSHRGVVTEFVRKLIRADDCTVWITTRPNEQRHLEDRLGVFAYSLDPFDENDKVSFFMKRWSGRDVPVARLNVFVESLIGVIDRSVRGIDTKLLEIPLQCNMFAEIFDEELSEFCRSDRVDPDLPRIVDVIGLYEKFMDKKCEVYLKEKKTGIESTVDASKKMLKVYFKQFIDTHKLLGVLLLFDGDVLDRLLTEDERDEAKTSLEEIQDGEEKMGVVECVADGKPIFVHRKIAEYCAALWFVARARQEPARGFIAENLFKPEHESLKRFFDLLAAKEIPELRSALSGDDRTVGRMLERDGDGFFEKVDRFGRNVLHLTASYPYDEAARKVIMAAGTHVKQKDRFLDWTPLRYACASAVWSNVETLLTMSDEDIVPIIDDATDLMFQSVRHGYSNIVRCLIAGRADIVHATNERGQTPLLLSAPFGHLQICKSLIEAGARIDARDDSDISVLHYVSIAQRPDIVETIEYLSNGGVDIDTVDKSGSTPLHYAAVYGCPAVCEVFVKEFHADVNAKNASSMNPLHYAVTSSLDNRLEVVKVLVEAGSRVNDTSDKGITPLMIAAKKGNEDICKYLVLEAKADVNQCDEHGDNVLHYLARSAKKNRAEIARFMIREGADVGAVNKDSCTPLHFSVMNLDRDTCKVFVTEGKADVNAANRAGASVLHHVVYTSEEDRLEIVRDLIEAGAVVDVADWDGNTPFLLSAVKGNVNLCKYFITQTSADVRARNKEKKNVLHCVASSFGRDRVEIAREVIRAGADVNGRDMYGTTPLHLAIMCADLGLCRYLVTETDADLCARNSSQMAVLHSVAYRTIDDGEKVARLLVDAGAALEDRNDDGATPLHLVSSCSRPEVCKYLTRKTSADIEARDNEGRTPLHYAAKSRIRGRGAIVRQLVISGADLDAVDVNGASALMTGLRCGNKQVCIYMIEMGADVYLKDARRASVWHYLVGADLNEGEQIEIAGLLSESVPVDTVDEDGTSPLLLAAQLGRLSVYEYLVSTAEIQSQQETSSFSNRE